MEERWMRDLGVGGEPSELEAWGGGGGPEEEGGLGYVELGGDGLHPTRVGGLRGVLEDAHRGRVALERLRREGVHKHFKFKPFPPGTPHVQRHY
jgi:hypothetical protein